MNLVQRKTVLVVEDSIALRELFFRALKSPSNEVHLAENGAEAIHLIEKGLCPQVILFDLTMPTMGGAEFLLNIRKSTNAKNAKTIIISGVHGLATKAKEMGVDGFLKKPVDLNMLCEQVKKYAAD
ncbi:MAG TPA: response regulator [Burkholderiales bacterium]|nr:response regulator [Burkholderiales bacterium]